jgi:predicted O-methyltransferase YrrM
MMELINNKAEAYAQNFSSAEDKLLQEVAAFTGQHPHAQMLSGHVQGKILETLSCLVQPKRILEIGTFTGYSALCLAKGLQPNGILHTIELRESDASNARNFFSKSLQNNKIVLHAGNALEIIPSLHETWDIVFIDADKVSYIDYYELTLPNVRPNGLLIADNVLFHGEVLEDSIKGKNAKAIHAFNEHVANDNRVEQVMLTVRDGLLLIRKL